MKKKILVVASTANHLVNFHKPYIKELKRKYSVSTMATSSNGNNADFEIKFEKKMLSINNLKVIFLIRKIIKKNNFETLFLNTSLASFFVRLAIKFMKNRPQVVNIVHGYLFSKRGKFIHRPWFLLAEKLVKNQTDNIIVMNDEDKYFAEKYKLCKNKIYKIDGMGIDSGRFSTNKSKNLKSHNSKILTFIGELSSRKNHKFLIKFIKELRKQNIPATLNLVGDGKKKNLIEKYIKKNHLEKYIKLCGYDYNIERFLLKSDYYICASKIEGLPFNILEAMYVGSIVFTSDIKGNSDLIKNNENGILFNLNDMKGLIQRFKEVDSDEGLKQKFSDNAICTAKKYTLEKVFSNNMLIFTDLINNK